MSDNIYLLVGESGCGKTTLVEDLARVFGWHAIESYTTRPRRQFESFGHIFVTDQEFDALTDIVAYTEFNGCRYAVTYSQIEENELYIVDPSGVEYFVENYRGRKKPKVVYIKVPEHQCLARMRKRGDSIDAAVRRVLHDRKAFLAFEDMADFVVVNDIYEKCLLSLVDWINEQEVNQ